MKKTYRLSFFGRLGFDPRFLVIFLFVVAIILIVSVSLMAGDLKETNPSGDYSFWKVFWANSTAPEILKIYPSPIIKNVPIGMEYLIIALAIWFFITSLIWLLVAVFDKVVLTDEFIKYGGKFIRLSDIEKIRIGEPGVSVIAKIYPAVPQPSELPQLVLKREKTKFDLPAWLINTNFFEDLKHLAPQIEVNIPQLKAYRMGRATFVFLVFIAIFLAFGGFFWWASWIKSLPFSQLGSFNFIEFFQRYPFAEKIFIGVGGLIIFSLFLFLALGLVFIYDSSWRRAFFKTLTIFGFLHFLGWPLYYFGVLK